MLSDFSAYTFMICAAPRQRGSMSPGAEIMGWEEESVSKIIRKYVDRSAATKAIIRQLNKRAD
jgi:hypothetical protein